MILNAADDLKSIGNIVFLLVGGGAQREWIEKESQRRGLKNIMFKPYQSREKLNLSLSASDLHLILLRPALEGLIVPSKFYGIAAVGRPTIYVVDIFGEIPRVLEREGCGYTVSIGASKELSDCILNLSRDFVRVQKMGVQARKAFDRHYDKRHAFNAWKNLLAQVI